jgi:hypothetical protein
MAEREREKAERDRSEKLKRQLEELGKDLEQDREEENRDTRQLIREVRQDLRLGGGQTENTGARHVRKKCGEDTQRACGGHEKERPTSAGLSCFALRLLSFIVCCL